MHTHPLPVPLQACLHYPYMHSQTKMRMIVGMSSVTAVIPGTIVLLLGQFSNHSLQLFARLLLLLQKLFHPLIFLQNIQAMTLFIRL